jgi:predicted DsbA family dithiol-disulfide isomerase
MDKIEPVARIDVISDAICPWCYIGKRQFERAMPILAQEGLHFSVMWHPFQLNPDMPAEGVDRKSYRETKFGGPEKAKAIDERITETAATVGLEFHLEKLTRTPNTVNAHRLIRYAAQQGVQDAVVEALFKGYFCEGTDIGDAEILAGIGGTGGLDPDAVFKMLKSDEGHREVLAGDQMARNAGIQGVPSFAMNGHVLFSGAQPAEEMAKAFSHAWNVLKNQAA